MRSNQFNEKLCYINYNSEQLREYNGFMPVAVFMLQSAFRGCFKSIRRFITVRQLL
jgi:hypothetical protein